MSPITVEECEHMTHVPYASILGNLTYATVCTRPDLSQLSQWLADICMIPGEYIGRQ